MEYNLTKLQKEAAKWLVNAYRENDLPEEIELHEFMGSPGFTILTSGGKLTADFSLGTFLALADEKLIDMREKLIDLGIEGSPKLEEKILTFRGRLFNAVDTNFGEIREASPIPSDGTIIRIDIKVYRELLERDFTLEELKTLCLDMKITYENLGSSNTLESRIREIIQYCQRHGRFVELLITTAKARHRNPWSELWN